MRVTKVFTLILILACAGMTGCGSPATTLPLALFRRMNLTLEDIGSLVPIRPDERKKIRCTICNRESSPVSVSLEIRHKLLLGRETIAHERVRLAANAKRELDIPVALQVPGVHVITVTAMGPGNSVFARATRTVNVWIPAGNTAPDTSETFFGCMESLDSMFKYLPRDLEIMRDAGVKIVRFVLRFNGIRNHTWFIFHHMAGSAKNFRDNYAALDWNNRIRPVVLAHNTAVHCLRGSRPLRELDLGFALAMGAVSWDDIDKDGYPDLTVSGIGDDKKSHTVIYFNRKGNGFEQAKANLPGVFLSAHAWADLNQDQRLDLLLAGQERKNAVTEVYLNTENGFVPMGAGLLPARSASIAVGDIDKNGLPDIVFSGIGQKTGYSFRVYRNFAFESTAKSKEDN